MMKHADISDCGRFRYSLLRRWEPGGPALSFIMLNPSTADAEKDDPTIRRCVDFAKRHAFSAIFVVNLTPYRATEPYKLWDHMNDIEEAKEKNDDHLIRASIVSPFVVCAWGANPVATRVSLSHEVKVAMQAHAYFECLGVNKDGSPRHPLYVPADTQMQDYAP